MHGARSRFSTISPTARTLLAYQYYDVRGLSRPVGFCLRCILFGQLQENQFTGLRDQYEHSARLDARTLSWGLGLKRLAFGSVRPFCKSARKAFIGDGKAIVHKVFIGLSKAT